MSGSFALPDDRAHTIASSPTVSIAGNENTMRSSGNFLFALRIVSTETDIVRVRYYTASSANKPEVCGHVQAAEERARIPDTRWSLRVCVPGLQAKMRQATLQRDATAKMLACFTSHQYNATGQLAGTGDIGRCQV